MALEPKNDQILDHRNNNIGFVLPCSMQAMCRKLVIVLGQWQDSRVQTDTAASLSFATILKENNVCAYKLKTERSLSRRRGSSTMTSVVTE